MALRLSVSENFSHGLPVPVFLLGAVGFSSQLHVQRVCSVCTGSVHTRFFFHFHFRYFDAFVEYYVVPTFFFF